jgi:hypothetical protein
LNALKAHDDVLANELSLLRTELGRRGVTKVDADAFSKITIDLPMDIDKSFGDRLSTLLVENTTVSWDFWYGLLLDYVNKYKSSYVKSNFVTNNGYQLGRWILKQRSYHAKGLMNYERIKKFEKLTNWKWDVHESNWINAFEFLKEFEKKYHHTRVGKGVKTVDNIDMQSWCTTQRLNKATLQKEKVDLLNSLENWNWDPHDAAWDLGFEELKKFIEINGHSLMTAKFKTDNGFNLGAWVSHQRLNKDSLTQERLEKIQNLPHWSWDVIGDKWESDFKDLLIFVEKYGHALVGRKHRNDFIKTYNWVCFQRQKRNKLTQSQIEKLSALPGWSWNTREDKWSNGYQHLIEHIQAAGNLNIKYDFVCSDGYKLGAWLKECKRKFIDKSLNTDRINLLEKIENWSWN